VSLALFDREHSILVALWFAACPWFFHVASELVPYRNLICSRSRGFDPESISISLANASSARCCFRLFSRELTLSLFFFGPNLVFSPLAAPLDRPFASELSYDEGYDKDAIEERAQVSV
jgi:hypothetical protein